MKNILVSSLEPLNFCISPVNPMFSTSQIIEQMCFRLSDCVFFHIIKVHLKASKLDFSSFKSGVSIASFQRSTSNCAWKKRGADDTNSIMSTHVSAVASGINSVT